MFLLPLFNKLLLTDTITTMNKLSILLACVATLFSCYACDKTTFSTIPHDTNFYYWKRSIEINEVEKNYLDELKTETLYVRYFDVINNADNQIVPNAKALIPDSLRINQSVTPVVFIDNNVFYNQEIDMEGLVNKMTYLIKEMNKYMGVKINEEIQIDCDWTPSTRDAYFNFLSTLKNTTQEKVSCTLRLHQIKDCQTTGIPPVDKGFLMCYATTSPKDDTTENSILDMNLLKNYTANIEKYPLDFDVILPLFSWGVVRNHKNQIKLINALNINDIQEYVEKIGENVYQVKEDFFYKGLYINKDFTIRVEMITPKLLGEAKIYLSSKLTKPYTLVYYHLDEDLLSAYSLEQLKN